MKLGEPVPEERRVVRVQVEALSGVEGDRDVAFEQDEGFVVGEVPLEGGWLGGEEGRRRGWVS